MPSLRSGFFALSEVLGGTNAAIFRSHGLDHVRQSRLQGIVRNALSRPVKVFAGLVQIIEQEGSELDPQFPVLGVQAVPHASRGIKRLPSRFPLNPQFADAYCGRGTGYATKGDLDKAIADDSEAIRLDPKLAQAHYNRGSAYLGKGDFGKAIADVTETIRLAPQAPSYYEVRGAMRINRRRL